VGYKEDPVFVFEGQLLKPDPSGKLSLSVLLGVCEEICIPAQAAFEIPLAELNRSDPQASVLLEQAQYHLPQEPSDTFKVDSIALAQSGELKITANIKENADTPQLFIEGPNNWYFEPGKLTRFENGVAEFTVTVDGLPKDADIAKEELRLTLAIGSVGIEEWHRIEP